jgi:predicted alpha/beta-fold hydrolase
LLSQPYRRRRILTTARRLLAASRELTLECGQGVRLQAFHAPQPAERGAPRLAVLLHGWEGSAESHYALGLAHELYARGFEVARLNLRDHGATHHLNRELFHSCRLPEVVGALRAISALTGCGALHLAGFSLGGNFMLRAAAQAHESGLAIAQVVAVSPVLEPSATLVALEEGLPLYERYFVRKWRRSLALKQAAWPGDYDFAQLARYGDLRRMTAELVSRFTEFGSLEEYLDGYAITGARLARLAVPATIITALDDPIVPAQDLVRLARSAPLRVILTRHGGHCGFLERLSATTWAERRAAAELDARGAAAPAATSALASPGS